MTRLRTKLALATAGAAVLGGAGAVAMASGGGGSIDETLTGFEEVPALSTPGLGTFRAWIDPAGGAIHYELAYDNLESAVTQAHIHFENETNNGPIVVFLCTNLGNGPAGTQACPADGGAVSGTITAADVGAGAADQGLAAGEFDEFVRALRAGATYVNVHSEGRPTGEIRAQLGHDDRDDGRARFRDHSEH